MRKIRHFFLTAAAVLCSTLTTWAAYNGTPQTPVKITADNYETYGFTADNWQTFKKYYAISTAEELYGFAELVNSGTTDANAVLTANIVVNENVLNADGTLNGTPTYSWTPIGTESNRYAGTFDGNNHTVSGLYFNNTTYGNYPAGGNYVGLIGYAYYYVYATIKNVGVIDSYLKGFQYVGGICGYAYAKITNCYNTGTVSGYYYVGGICGSGGYQTNCYNTGTVSASYYYVGGICGESGTQTNCYNTGTVSGNEYVGGICGESGTQTNCYYLEGCAKDGNNVVQNGVGNGTEGQTTADVFGWTISFTTDDFANGKVTYGLNGKTSEGDLIWYQTLGSGGDAHPVLDNTHGVVYEKSQPCTSEFSNTKGSVSDKEHPSMNAIGYCTACSRFIAQGATLVTTGNCGELNLTADFVDYYAISNSADLYWFANEVNNGSTTINAVLTADIVVNENVLKADGKLNGKPTYRWTPIGTSTNKYAGTFDGNSHTISGLCFTNTTYGNYPEGGNYVGLIGYADGAMIKNVGVIDSYIEGYGYVGGICGSGYGSNTKITNCYNTGTVSSGYDWVGGICGSGGTQTNCYNTGMVSCFQRVGGICGQGGTQTNCYYLEGCGSQNTLGTSATAEEFASGKITWLLNGSTSEGDLVWYQTIGTDALPVWDNTHAVVYATQPCPSFSNDEHVETNKEHLPNAIGYCTACGQYIAQAPNLVTESNYSNLNLTADFEGYYAISKTAELYWFADKVNSGSATINAVLTADIVVNENVLNADGTLNGTPTYSWTPIGTSSNNFKGTFDGNGHTIKGLYFNNTTNSNHYPAGGSRVGLIGYAYRAAIKNVGVIDSYIRGSSSVGGICGYADNNTYITNCYNTGTVSGSSSVGGICGYSYVGTQTNCYNTGTVSGSSSVGGICGSGYGGTQNNCYNTGTVSGSSSVGGIRGYDGTQTNCYNTGTVSGSNNYVGGICGYGNYSTITNCHNTGGVSGSEVSKIGGICGSSGTQTNCYNTGTVSGFSNYVGGICGYQGTQTNCYNTGTVSGSSNYANYVGGICGDGGTQTNCYYLTGCAKDGDDEVQYGVGNSTQGEATADIEGKTTSATTNEFSSGKIAYLLNGGTFEGTTWRQTLLTDELPLLDASHNAVTGYFDEVENVVTVYGNVVLTTNYTIAEGKTLTNPEGASLTTTGEAVITNNGTLIVVGEFSGNNLAGEGSFYYALLADADVTLNTASYTYKGTAYEIGNGLDITYATHTILGKDFTFSPAATTITYTANTNAGAVNAATVTWNGTISRTFTITPKDVELVWGETEFTYNGEAQAPSATATGLVGEDACTVNVSGAQKNKGLYTATATSLSNTNYALPDANTKAFTINTKEVGLAWSEAEFTYNGAEQAPTATVTGLVDGDACTVNVAGAQKNKGLYTATATSLSNTNYALPDANTKAFTINAKEVGLAWGEAEFTYNGVAQAPTATATGMVNGEELTVTVSGEQTAAGTYTATASISDNNYKLPEVVTKEFTIGKATPTYTAPENLSIKCNESLANITLPAGFAFENLNVELTEGDNTLTVKFTPEDTDNYKVVEGIEVKVVKAAHAVVTDVAVPATCTESGLTEGSHCSVCHTVLVAQEVIPAGHTMVTDDAIAATCTETGLTEGSHCSVCNEVLVAQEEIPATGHKADSVAIENIVEATRTAAGSYDSVVYCSVCRVELSRTTVEVPQIVAETIKLASKPNKVEYKQGEALDVKGGKITVAYSDKSTEDYEILTGWVSGFNSEKVGKQTLTVKYEAVSSTLTTTFDVTVSAKDDDNTAVDEDAASKVSIYAYQNVIVVENANAEIYVYDAMGRLVERNIGNNSRTEIRMNNAGVYIVKVGNAAKRVMVNN